MVYHKDDKRDDKRNPTNQTKKKSQSTSEPLEVTGDDIIKKLCELMKSHGSKVPSIKYVYEILCTDHLDLFKDSQGEVKIDMLRKKSCEIFDAFIQDLVDRQTNLGNFNLEKSQNLFNRFFNNYKNSSVIEIQPSDSYLSNIAPILMTTDEQNKYSLSNQSPNPITFVVDACTSSGVSDDDIIEIIGRIDNKWQQYETICKLIGSYISYKGQSFKQELNDSFIRDLENCQGNENAVYRFISERIDKIWRTPQEVIDKSIENKFKIFTKNCRISDNLEEYLGKMLKEHWNIESALIKKIIVQVCRGQSYCENNPVENCLLEDLGITFKIVFDAVKDSTAKYDIPSNTRKVMCSTEDIRLAFLACFVADSEKMLAQVGKYSSMFSRLQNFQTNIAKELEKFFVKDKLTNRSPRDIEEKAKEVLSLVKAIKSFKHLIDGIREIDELRKKTDPSIEVKGMVSWLENFLEKFDQFNSEKISGAELFDTFKGYVAEVEHVKYLLGSDNVKDNNGNSGVSGIRTIQIGLTYGPSGKFDFVFSEQGELDCLITFMGDDKVGVEVKASENAYKHAKNLGKHKRFCNSEGFSPSIVVFTLDGVPVGARENITPHILPQTDIIKNLEDFTL